MAAEPEPSKVADPIRPIGTDAPASVGAPLLML